MKIKNILGIIRNEYSGKAAKKLAAALYDCNRLISFDAYEAGARLCFDELKNIDADDVELIPFPSDGKVLYGNWRTPPVWKIKKASLRLKIGGRWKEYINYPKIPTSVFAYSSPTKGEISTELILYTGGGDPKGKLAWTEPSEEKIDDLAKRGACGIATSFAPNWEGIRGEIDFQKGHRWDNDSLLEFTEYGLAGFSFNRKQGQEISELLQQQGSIPCRFSIDSSLGAGSIYAVTATIKGSDQDAGEVLCIAHLYEPGANDNASGVAGAIECLRTINKLVATGKLPPPRRTIRILFTHEIVGFMAYFERFPLAVRNVVAAVNPDMIGENQKRCRSTLHVYKTPLAFTSYTDDLLYYFIENCAGKNLKFALKNYIVNDNSISDSAIGIPCPALIHLRDQYYHSNIDNMACVSSSTLGIVGSAMCAYLYTIAGAADEEWREIAAICTEKGRERLARLLENHSIKPNVINFHAQIEAGRIASIEDIAAIDLRSHKDVLLQQVNSFSEINATALEKLPLDFAKMIPRRTIIGPLTLDQMTRAERKQYRILPKWSAKWHLALSWIDGKRSFGEIFRLASIESPSLTLADFTEYFNMLVDEKLIGLMENIE